MFIQKSWSDEIATGMEQRLVDSALSKRAEAQDQLLKVAALLNSAAELLDDGGLSVEAEIVTTLMEVVAAKKSKRKPAKRRKSKSNKAPKAPSSAKMVENLKHKGWVFDEGGAMDHSCVDDNCAMCGDVGYAADTERKLERMLDAFKERADRNNSEDRDDKEFEDDFEIEVHDPFAKFDRIHVDEDDEDDEDDDDVRIQRDPFEKHRIRL